MRCNDTCSWPYRRLHSDRCGRCLAWATDWANWDSASQRHTLHRPITTIKHTRPTEQQQQQHWVDCIVAIFLYGFMRFGIANKSIYFNYNYRLECRSRLHRRRSDSLPCSASSAAAPPPPPPPHPPPAAARRLSSLARRRAWPSAHYFCSSARPLIEAYFWSIVEKWNGLAHSYDSYLASRITYLRVSAAQLEPAGGRERFSLISAA